MKTIDINTSRPYRVLVGENLLRECGSLIRREACLNKAAETAAIITDDTVNSLYGEVIEESLKAAGFCTVKYVLPHGEESKNTGEYINILEFLASTHLTRSDFLVALGGGVAGDMAGFAAASYLRGVDFIQVPTTLLACVDSSVGGKTGIDLKAGKNLAGAFHQPRLVICDTQVLGSLPESTFKDGCAEVIKYGVLFDGKLFSHLEEHGLSFGREYVVARCIELKCDVVVEDEHDNGSRQLLNFGHTLAHALEQKSNFTVSHGQAVAVGMGVFSRAAAAVGKCSGETAEKICALIKAFGLPLECAFNPGSLYEAMLNDKKRRGGSISIIVPREIGRCEIWKIPVEELKPFMEKGMRRQEWT